MRAHSLRTPGGPLALSLALSLVLVACDDKRAPPPSPTAPSATAREAVDSAAEKAPVMGAVSDAGRLEAPLTVAPPASAAPDGVLPDNAFVSGFPGGAVRIYAVPADDARTSDVLLQVLGEKGEARGAPRKIRRTSGSVEALSAFVDGTTAWVAWRSQNGTSGFGAVMRVSLDTFAIAGPRMLGNVSALPATGSVRIISDGQGGAVLATNGAEVVVPCLLREEAPPCRGPSVLVAHVPADFPAREPRVLAQRGVDGGPVAEVRGLSLVGTDRVFVDVRAMHGGAVTDAALLSLVAGDASATVTPVATPGCGLLDRTYVEGDRIIAIAEDGYWQEKDTCPTRKNPTLSCATVGVASLVDGRDARTVAAPRCAPRLSTTVRCEAGRQIEHVRYRGGELDVRGDRPCAAH